MFLTQIFLDIPKISTRILKIWPSLIVWGGSSDKESRDINKTSGRLIHWQFNVCFDGKHLVTQCKTIRFEIFSTTLIWELFNRTPWSLLYIKAIKALFRHMVVKLFILILIILNDICIQNRFSKCLNRRYHSITIYTFFISTSIWD